MRRISVVGNTGAGKSTVARALQQRLGLARLELDAVHHLPEWTTLHRDPFRSLVSQFIADEPSWVIDGNYAAVRDLIWEAADTVVWLDPELGPNMRAVVARTVRRVVTGEELWNGNRERWANLFKLHDPDASIIRWAWSRHAVVRDRYRREAEDPAHGHLRFVRLGSRAEVRAWLATVERPEGS